MIEAVTKLSHKTDWETPVKDFEYIEKNYVKKKFTVDLCATKDNAKCDIFISPEIDLLKTTDDIKFHNEVCFMNPPYERGMISKFLSVARLYRDVGNCTVAVLVYSNISRTEYFRRLVGEFEHERIENKIELYFPNTIKFLDSDKKPVGSPAFAPMVIVYRGNQE